MRMSKEDFEKRLTHAPHWIKDLYFHYEHVFAEDLVSVHWSRGWSHIVEGLLRNFEKDPNAKIVKIKSHFSQLYVHWYGIGNNQDDLIEQANYCCAVSCRECGSLIDLGDRYCEHCR